MELVVAQSCPSCGAEITLAEDARLLRCPYCDVNNYRIERSAPRYLLPARLPAHLPPEDILYVPYLRFKGTVYEIREGGVDQRLLDTTRVGIETTDLPASLGLRPQAMRLLPMTAASPGRYVRQGIAGDEAFAEALTVAGLLRRKSLLPLYHRAFIGETLSRIYQPCYFQDGVVYDAVVRRPLGSGEWLSQRKVDSLSSHPDWEPRFLSAHCPHCGEVLEGAGDALVLHCGSCRSLWLEQDGSFRRLAWATIPHAESNALYLPFWQVTFVTEGQAMRSFGDYLRFTNQPLRVSREHDNLPLSFCIPAFKLNPKAFLQVAAQLTLGQWRLGRETAAFPEKAHAVNLPAKEAVQAIKTVLAQTTVAKKKRLPLVAEMLVVRPSCRLLYVAFVERGQDYIEERSGATVLDAALRHGRNL